MKRSEINEQDTWDLTKYFKSNKEYEELYNKTLNLSKEIVSMKGKIYENSDSLYKFLKLDEEVSLNLETIYVYSYLYHYADTNDETGKELRNKADILDDKISEETSFVRSEMLSIKYEEVKKIINNEERFEPYLFSLEKMFRYQNHTLSEQEEKIIALAGNAFGGCHSTFSALDNGDAKFPTIVLDGEEIEITHSNFIKLMTNKNRDVRKEAFQKYYSYFIDRKNTISELYKGQVKEDIFYSKVRKFSSPLEASLYSDNIEVDVYNNLINTIHDNLDKIYNYMDFRKEFLKLDELHMYDVYVDLVNGEPRKFTFDEAKETILKALSPLGEQYIKDLSKAFEERWIDKYPNDGKRSGAYQWGSYGVTPYVSINFEGTEDSVSTLAHELGHAMHSFYSDKTQNYNNAQYPIFLAEIASTVNEVLLNEYLIENAENDDEKLLYITSFLDKFRTTVYRQTMFAEFEKIAHEMEQNGDSLTTEKLSNMYYELNKQYFGDKTVSDEEIKYEWSRIPHFYTSFYVYKYATGFCAALAIASDILNNVKDAKENYIKFLSSGGSKYPLETLKECNVDMTKKDPIIKGLKMFDKKLKQAKELVEKVK